MSVWGHHILLLLVQCCRTQRCYQRHRAFLVYAFLIQNQSTDCDFSIAAKHGNEKLVYTNLLDRAENWPCTNTETIKQWNPINIYVQFFSSRMRVRRWNLWFPSAGVFAEVLTGRATGMQITSFRSRRWSQ